MLSCNNHVTVILVAFTAMKISISLFFFFFYVMHHILYCEVHTAVLVLCLAHRGQMARSALLVLNCLRVREWFRRGKEICAERNHCSLKREHSSLAGGSGHGIRRSVSAFTAISASVGPCSSHCSSPCSDECEQRVLITHYEL